MSILPLLLYRIFYFIGFALAQMLAFSFKRSKLAHWVQLRDEKLHVPSDLEGCIWFHVSSGEIEYCKAVIKAIKAKSPQEKVILSYSSPSAVKLISNIEKDLNFVFPLPWDLPSTCSELIRKIKPKSLIFSRTDFWPELIYQAQKQKIQLGAISIFTRLTLAKKMYLSWLLSSFKLITVVHEELKKNLQPYVTTTVYKTSDTRFDQVFARLNEPSKINLDLSKKYIVFGSTWKEDDEQLIPYLDQILAAGYTVIYCPHQYTEDYLKMFQTDFKKSKLVRLSEFDNNFDILLVDKVGYLADLYRFSDIAFVGGSFKKRIHSVMEAQCAKNIVFMGPRFQNNPEAIEATRMKISYSYPSGSQIISHILSLKSEEIALTKRAIENYTTQQKGSSAILAEKILDLK